MQLFRTIDDFLGKSSCKYPDKTAVIDRQRSLTYREINVSVLQLAKELRQSGVKSRDRIGIFLEKSPEEIIAIFAIVRAGGVFVSINPKLKDAQIKHIIDDCGIRLIITSESMWKLSLKRVIEDVRPNSAECSTSGKYRLIKIKGNKNISNIGLDIKKVVCIIYTSGSTGKPKGVVISQEGLMDGAHIVSQYLHCRHSDRVLSLLPLSFDYGLNQLVTTFKNGATIVLQDFIFPEDVLRVIEKENITALAGIPTIWIGLMNSAGIGHYDLSSLRYVTNSGGKIPVEYVKRMIKVFSGTKIYLMYGLTEAFRSTYLPSELTAKKPDSIGKAIPRVSISVLNKDGKECGTEETGELVHRGALISMGYWGNKEATDSRIRKLPSGAKNRKRGEVGVFSGDLVKKDREGFLYYVGRNDEMIKSSGYRISPTEIEEVLYKIRGVEGAVAFGVDDVVVGQKIKVVVACSRKLEKRTIIDKCRKDLPYYAVPHDIMFIKQFPKTSSGKLDRSFIKSNYGK